MTGTTKRPVCPVLVFAVALVACDGDGPVGNTFALFRPGAARLFELPYPSDLRVGRGGTLDLAHLESGQLELVQRYVDFARTNPTGGFATGGGGAFFRFSGPIDPDTLPGTPEASREPDSSVQWINVATGRRLPVLTRFTEKAGKFIGANHLAVHPVPGFVLQPATRYAVLITDRLEDRDGHSVRAEPGFAFDARVGVDGVVAAADFTTGQPTRLIEKIRDRVRTLPAPRAEGLSVAAETADYYEIRGVYQAPNFQTGEPPYLTPDAGGVIETDAAGNPVVQRTETMRFVLSLPRVSPPSAGFPVVLYAHGTGGDYRACITRGVAGHLARITDDAGAVIARVATLGIDQVVHGERVPPGTNPDVVVFNMTNPGSWVYNLVQGAADGFSLGRMAQGLGFTRLPWGEGTGRTGEVDFGGTVKLDPGRVCVVGHSQGGITSPPFIASSQQVGCAVLSGAGAGAAVSFLEQTTPTNVAALVQLALKESVDRYHPLVSFWQQILDPADPGNYARRIVAGPGPKHLFLTEGVVDHYTPVETTEALATAAGIPQLGDVLRPAQGLGLLGIEPGPLPAKANVDGGGQGKVTAGLVQHEGLPTGAPCSDAAACETGYCDTEAEICRNDGHHVLFQVDAAIRQLGRFVGTYARDGVPTLVR